jgi:RNA methyltransferase, TrmH family
LRIHGRAACLAVAADRFGAIRKLWHSRKRAGELGPLLSKLAAAKVGYREVDDEELTRVAGSEHHEGICLDIVRLPESTVDDLRERLADEAGPVLLLALAGVGNPHNLGAILRSAAHFGALAVLLPADGTASLSGAVYRTAEGAAERVEIVRYSEPRELRLRGFTVLATAADGQRPLYAQPLPARTLLLLGAEGSGLDAASRTVADEVLAIPGSGRVESLNVSQAATVLAGEWWRVQRAGARIRAAGDG